MQCFCPVLGQSVDGPSTRTAEDRNQSKAYPAAHAAYGDQGRIPHKPRTSRPHPQHKIYPYLLRGLCIDRPNQVWATGTCIRLMAISTCERPRQLDQILQPRQGKFST